MALVTALNKLKLLIVRGDPGSPGGLLTAVASSCRRKVAPSEIINQGPTMHYRYVVADVFTDKPFAGNPLAVFPEADGLSSEEMQRIASELNLSETAFVVPPEIGGDARVRIFTPASELPFAGHPTVGTAIVMARIGTIPAGTADLVFEEAAGLVPVSLEWWDGNATIAWLTAPVLPRLDADAPAPEDIAQAISLHVSDIDVGAPGPAVLSAGNPFLFVPLRGTEALAKARVDPGGWRSLMDELPANGLYMFCFIGPRGSKHLRARLFAPDQGIPEDPATGSAAAALPADLVQRYKHPDGVTRWDIEQGIEMGRPSELKIEVTVKSGAIEAVRVGGKAVIVSEGTMDVPSGETS